MTTQHTPVEVFCLYAHEDEDWLRKLEKHLSLLKRQGLIALWHDRLIAPGTDWTKEIDSHLETASIILLLVSAHFFASDYCYGVEMKRALERQQAGEARVIPIVVREVDWRDAPFAHLQALPTDTKPIASWRNTDEALADVTAGIRRVIIEDLPQLAASASYVRLPSIQNIPYPRNPFFLGRDEELAHVRHCLQAGETIALSQPHAISGLGGIGKTQLALEYAYRYGQGYQAILWARAESPEALVSSYVALAALLGLPEREAKEQEVIVEAVKRWLQAHRDWLLILDNADELAILPDFLPPTLEGHLLLTTRAQATGRLAYRIDIEILSSNQGALLLLRRSGLLPPDASLEQALPGEQALAIQITQELGGLPLALDQAGAYLDETRTSLAEYWQLYQKYRTELLRERRGGFVADHPLPVATTWSVSFQRIEARNPGAAELLRLLAWLPADAVAQELLPAGAAFLGPVLAPIASNELMLNQAIEALRAYSLVRRDPRAQTLSMHRLVQAVLQDQQKEVERQIWTERVIRAVNVALPAAEYGAWTQCERLLLLALTAAEYIDQQKMTFEEAGRLLLGIASYLYDRGRYREAEPLFQRALSIWEQQFGPEHPKVAETLNNLALLYRDQGKYAEAEPLYQRALHIREQQLGPVHPLVADTLNGLANLYTMQGKYAEAEPVLATWVIRSKN